MIQPYDEAVYREPLERLLWTVPPALIAGYNYPPAEGQTGPRRQFIGVRDGHVYAYGISRPDPPAGTMIWMLVDDTAASDDTRSLLLSALLTEDSPPYHTWTMDDDPVSLRFLEEAGFVALRRIDWDNRLHHAMTGVLPEFRGRGVATALKVLGLRYARQTGAPLITTGNDARNAPMLAINRKLGYQPIVDRIHLRKEA